MPKNLIIKDSLNLKNKLKNSFSKELNIFRDLYFPNELKDVNKKLLEFINQKLK
jgi:hypothetical protein